MIKYHPRDNKCLKCGSVFEAKDVFFARTIFHPIKGRLKIKCAYCGYTFKKLTLDAQVKNNG